MPARATVADPGLELGCTGSLSQNRNISESASACGGKVQTALGHTSATFLGGGDEIEPGSISAVWHQDLTLCVLLLLRMLAVLVVLVGR